MKIDARLVKQSVGMIVGGVIFAWSAMDNTSNQRRVRK